MNMPRGVKRDRKEIIREELSGLKTAIESAENSISEMRTKMEELTRELNLIESEELIKLATDNGLTTEDIKRMIVTYNRDEDTCAKEVAATM